MAQTWSITSWGSHKPNRDRVSRRTAVGAAPGLGRTMERRSDGATMRWSGLWKLNRFQYLHRTSKTEQNRAGQGRPRKTSQTKALAPFRILLLPSPPCPLQSSEKRSTEAEVYNLKLTSTCQLTNLRESVKEYEKEMVRRSRRQTEEASG